MSSKKKPEPGDPQSLDEKLDRALEDTFPASDPVAISEPEPAKNDKPRKSGS